MRNLILPLFCALLFLSCSQSDIKQEIIGPGGGAVTSKDGRLRLTFPPNALSEATIIGIFELDPENLTSEFASLPVASSYLLMPEGLEFSVPVTATLILDESPLNNSGALETGLALLVTSANFTLEALPNLVQLADGASNTTVISGELTHFSQLAEVSLGVTASAQNIPSAISVGIPFGANISVFQTVGSPFGITPPVSYADSSASPVLCSNCAPDAALAAVMGIMGSFGGSFSYSCEASQTGSYVAVISFEINDINNLLPPNQAVDLRLSRVVACGG
ncbi:MAG: hypothetical protein ACT4NX_08025 [Deltaproteobacteria bacterium]